MYNQHEDTLEDFCKDFKMVQARALSPMAYDALSKGVWYDWFCKSTSLPAKTQKLGPKVCQIAKSHLIDPKKTYVWFKNNCPVMGHLYDDFRICDRKTDKVLFTVVPRSGFKKDNNKALVYGHLNGFKEPLAAGDWSDIKRFFGVK